MVNDNKEDFMLAAVNAAKDWRVKAYEACVETFTKKCVTEAMTIKMPKDATFDDQDRIKKNAAHEIAAVNKKMVNNAKNSFFAFEHVLRGLPSLISKTFYKIEEGEVTVNIEVKHISEIANQLSLAIIIAALLIGSSLVMLIDVGPRFYEMPVLGFVGFTISLALGVFTVLRYFIDF